MSDDSFLVWLWNQIAFGVDGSRGQTRCICFTMEGGTCIEDNVSLHGIPRVRKEGTAQLDAIIRTDSGIAIRLDKVIYANVVRR